MSTLGLLPVGCQPAKVYARWYLGNYGDTLSQYAAEINLEAGRFHAIAPENTSTERLEAFSPGLFPHAGLDVDGFLLEQIISSSRGQEHCLWISEMLQEPHADRPQVESDWFAFYPSRFGTLRGRSWEDWSAGTALLLRAHHGAELRSAASEFIREFTWGTRIAFFCGATGTKSSMPERGTCVPAESMRPLILGAKRLVVPAYDTETYLLWSAGE